MSIIKINEKMMVAIPVFAFWTMIVFCVTVTFASASAFWQIKSDIHQAMTRDDMSNWVNMLRDRNAHGESPLQVPPFPLMSQRSMAEIESQ